MNGGGSAQSGKRALVTVLGVSTLLLGVAYIAFGGWIILEGASWFAQSGDGPDPWRQFAALFGLLPAFVVLIGVAFLPLGILGLLAGPSVLLGKPWGRILTFILAVIATLLGLLWVGAGDQDAMDIALGAGQVLYGIFALVILISHGAEFSRPRVEVSAPSARPR